jgi:hypothetical protein
MSKFRRPFYLAGDWYEYRSAMWRNTPRPTITLATFWSRYQVSVGEPSRRLYDELHVKGLARRRMLHQPLIANLYSLG